MKTYVRPGVFCALVISSLAVFLTACANLDKGNASSRTSSRSVAKAPLPDPLFEQLSPSNLSPQLSEVVRLTHSGMSDSVMVAYVDKSVGPYHATADQLVSLRDAGVPQTVIAAIVRHPSARPVYVQQAQPVEAVQVVETNPPVATNTAVIVAQPPSPPVVVQQPATTTVTTATPVVVQAPDLVQFRSALDPFGRWIDVPNHGLCWQPTVAIRDNGWRPYHSSGRWLHTNHGWYWLSDYSWGWAAFHYGRWSNSRYGWVWVPGYDWGPAWVSWRRGRDHIGWAPLPPHAHFDRHAGFRFRGSRVSVRFEWGLGYNDYTFCSPAHFYHRTPYRHYHSRRQNVNIYNQTTVVNNYNASAASATPANTGVPVQAVQQASGTEVRRVQVLSGNAGNRTAIRPDRLVSNGQSLAVYRPPSPAAGSRTSVRTSTQASPVTRVNQPNQVGASPSRTTVSTSNSTVRRSSSPTSSGSARREIRPARKVESRTIFVETVPLVRRPASRPTGSSSTSTSSTSRTPVRTVVSTPPLTTTSPSRNASPAQSTPSRNTSRSNAGSGSRNAIRTVPTPPPTRTPTVSRATAAPPRVSAPSRTVIRTTPPKVVAAPIVQSRPTARPTPSPAKPTVRPTSRPVRVTPPPAPSAPSKSPSRQPASSTSGSKSSSDDTPSTRPSARPTRRPGGN